MVWVVLGVVWSGVVGVVVDVGEVVAGTVVLGTGVVVGVSFVVVGMSLDEVGDWGAEVVQGTDMVVVGSPLTVSGETAGGCSATWSSSCGAGGPRSSGVAGRPGCPHPGPTVIHSRSGTGGVNGGAASAGVAVPIPVHTTAASATVDDTTASADTLNHVRPVE